MFEQRPFIGLKVPGRRELWVPLLKEWHKVLNQYARLADHEDAPQWHRERSNVGLLGAAAWRLRGRACALQEYREPETGKKKVSNPDLWIRVNNHVFCVGVKLVRRFYGDVAGSKSEMSKVETKLQDAVRDVNEHDHGHARHGMGVCLASIFLPRLGAEQNYKYLSGITKRFARKFSDPSRVVYVSWLSLQKRLELERCKRESYLPAGTAFVGKLVW